MYWKEFIVLLAAESRIKLLLDRLPEKLREMSDSENLLDVQLYSSAMFSANLAVMLTWKGEKTDEQPKKSQLGLSLSDRLSNEGMISHTLWILQENSNPPSPEMSEIL